MCYCTPTMEDVKQCSNKNCKPPEKTETVFQIVDKDMFTIIDLLSTISTPSTYFTGDMLEMATAIVDQNKTAAKDIYNIIQRYM